MEKGNLFFVVLVVLGGYLGRERIEGVMIIFVLIFFCEFLVWSRGRRSG